MVVVVVGVMLRRGASFVRPAAGGPLPAAPGIAASIPTAPPPARNERLRGREEGAGAAPQTLSLSLAVCELRDSHILPCSLPAAGSQQPLRTGASRDRGFFFYPPLSVCGAL